MKDRNKFLRDVIHESFHLSGFSDLALADYDTTNIREGIIEYLTQKIYAKANKDGFFEYAYPVGNRLYSRTIYQEYVDNLLFLLGEDGMSVIKSYFPCKFDHLRA